eukprot:3928339-Lingulodinium_polyedra.AAC.1
MRRRSLALARTSTRRPERLPWFGARCRSARSSARSRPGSRGQAPCWALTPRSSPGRLRRRRSCPWRAT